MSVRPGRLLPSLVVGGLLVFAVYGATGSTNVPSPAVPAAMVYPACTTILQSASGESTLVMDAGGGVIQPFGFSGNMAACTLGVEVSTYTTGIFQIQSWDPVGVTPDPSTVALRSQSFSISSYSPWLRRFDFVPPLVLKTLGNVAEPQRTTAAIRYQRGTYDWGQTMRFTRAATGSMPGALSFVSGGTPVPIAGTHPAISHRICGGDQALQDLAVCQSVVRADSMFGNDVYTIVQRFRVPVWTQLYWVEMAYGYVVPVNPGGYLPGTVAILDAQYQTQPPATPGGALASASFSNFPYSASWMSHYDFDRSVVLEPHHDYWLYVMPVWNAGLYARRLDGTEGPTFGSGVGELWFSNTQVPVWRRHNQRALDFKIVGLPIGVLDAPAPVPVASALHLSARPNPARGATVIAWAGARGALRFEVIDPRGRRVASGEGNANAAGEWLFRGARDDGRPLAAGVYFVRAVDAAGQSAVERVVLVH